MSLPIQSRPALNFGMPSGPMRLETYSLRSTVWALFSAALVIHWYVDLRFFYFVIVFNLVLLLFKWKFEVDRGLFLSLLYLWIAGAISVVSGTNSARLFLQEALGITVCAFYFYLFFRQQRLDVADIFDEYANVAYYICGLGLGISAVASLWRREFVPVQSIMTEPAQFAATVLPGFYYYLASHLHGRGDGNNALKKSLVMLLAVVFSNSAVGFLGLFASLILLARGRKLLIVGMSIFVVALMSVLYTVNDHFRVRLDDSVRVLREANVEDVNLSTYALLSNAFVSWSALHDRPIFGYGIGAHQIAHHIYLPELPGMATVPKEYMDINAKDANSLLFRIASELGLVGLLLTAVFLVRCTLSGRSRLADISAAVMVYLFLKLLREGHWFSPEMYFFIWTFVLVFRKAKTLASSSERPFEFAANVIEAGCL